MLYPFMNLNDNTEIVHSEILENSGKEEVESKNQFRAAFIPPPAGFRNTAGKTFRDSLRKISIIFRSFWNPSPTSFCSWQEKVESKEVLIMPQVFKIAGYTVYFWVNENRSNQSTFILLRAFLLPMLPKYGLQSPENVFCATIIRKFQTNNSESSCRSSKPGINRLLICGIQLLEKSAFIAKFFPILRHPPKEPHHHRNGNRRSYPIRNRL